MVQNRGNRSQADSRRCIRIRPEPALRLSFRNASTWTSRTPLLKPSDLASTAAVTYSGWSGQFFLFVETMMIGSSCAVSQTITTPKRHTTFAWASFSNGTLPSTMLPPFTTIPRQSAPRPVGDGFLRHGRRPTSSRRPASQTRGVSVCALTPWPASNNRRAGHGASTYGHRRPAKYEG